MKAIQVTAKGRPLGGMLSQWWHFRLIPFVTSLIVRLLSHTLRIRYEGREHLEDLFARDERLILAFWHRRLLTMDGYLVVFRDFLKRFSFSRFCSLTIIGME